MRRHRRGTEFALYRYLVGQLDTNVHDASHDRCGYSVEPPMAHWRHHPRPFPRPGPGPVFLDAPAQPVGMVGAVSVQGRSIEPAT